MYLVRKKFMYWQVPSTTKVLLGDNKQRPYCFVPARLVSTLERTLKNIRAAFSVPVAKTLRDRTVCQRRSD